MDSVLRVEDLRTYFDTDEGVVKAVDGVSFELRRGETLGIVGESGSGKTVACVSILGLVPPSGRVVSGRVTFEGRDLLSLPRRDLDRVRGADIAMVFQDPLSALNPVLTVGDQISEAIRAHRDIGRQAARSESMHALARVGMPEPERRFDEYPHQLSGGMRQRAMIAVAVVCRPKVLIADEPTTALDVTIQAQVLALMSELKREHDSSVILITHDLGVIADVADSVMVMYAGRRVEYAPAEEIFADPRHPYTRGLLRSLSRVDMRREKDRLVCIPGAPPSLVDLPPGCHFSPRCRFRGRICSEHEPPLREVKPGHLSACHFAEVLREREGEAERRAAAAPGGRGAERSPEETPPSSAFEEGAGV